MQKIETFQFFKGLFLFLAVDVATLVKDALNEIS